MKKDIPTLRSAENICLDFCLNVVFSHPQRDQKFELFFDRGEKFHGIMRKLWTVRRPRRIWWASSIRQMREVENMREVPALQAADLLAWFCNRYWTMGHNDRWGSLFAMTFIAKAHYHALFDQPQILKLHDADGKMKSGVRIDPPKIQLPEGTKLLRKDD